MAIVIQQEPVEFQPVYNTLDFVVTSDNTGLANFKYVCDIKDVSGTTLLARLKQSPHPVLGNAHFDVHRTLENFVNTSGVVTSFDIDKDDAGFIECPLMGEGYLIEFREESGTPPVVGSVSATSSVLRAWNSIFDALDFVDYNKSDHILETATPPDYLTAAPVTQGVESGQNGWLYWLKDTANVDANATIVTKDSSGSTIQTVTIDSLFTTPLTNDNRYMRFTTGPRQLNLIPSGVITLGAQPIITSAVASYTVTITEAGPGSASGITRTYNITDGDCKYETIRLHWLNKLGGFDSFNFDKISRKTLTYKRQQYKRLRGNLTLNTFTYDKQERGVVTFDTQTTTRMILNTDLLTDAEAIFLEEAAGSPVMFLEESDGTLVAINSESTAYEIRKKINDKQFNFTMTISFGVTNARQRG